MKLEGKRALVTGGSEGIGRGIAEALLRQGTAVAVTGRREDVLAKAATEMGAIAIAGDVSDEAQVKSTVEKAVAELGGIDILVNNAGTGYFDKLTDIDLDRFKRVFEVNVVGAMMMAREVVPHLIRQGSGAIVNISSTAGLRGYAGGTAYVGTKFALKGMSECWMHELRRHDIRVMLVNPSEVQTSFMGKSPGELNPKKLRPEEIADAVVGALLIDARGFIPEFAVFATNPF